MKIAFYSMTGNCRRFIKRAGVEADFDVYEITSNNNAELIDDDYILVTSTIGFGRVPVVVDQFLEVNHKKLLAVASSGNRNWGVNFGRAGEIIRDTYNVPLIMKFELHGNDQLATEFYEKVRNIYENITRENVQSH